jgi:hypothetical protein
MAEVYYPEVQTKLSQIRINRATLDRIMRLPICALAYDSHVQAQINKISIGALEVENCRRKGIPCTRDLRVVYGTVRLGLPNGPKAWLFDKDDKCIQDVNCFSLKEGMREFYGHAWVEDKETGQVFDIFGAVMFTTNQVANLGIQLKEFQNLFGMTHERTKSLGVEYFPAPSSVQLVLSQRLTIPTQALLAMYFDMQHQMLYPEPDTTKTE